MTHGSNSRIGIAAGRAAVGAKVEAVMSNSWGISRPRLRRASPRKEPDSRSKTTDHSGATVPDLHRLPSATRMFTIRARAPVSIERLGSKAERSFYLWGGMRSLPYGRGSTCHIAHLFQRCGMLIFEL